MTIKETFTLFSSSVLGVRFQSKIKNRYLQIIKKELETDGYKCILWEEKKRGVKLYNLAVGNLEKAKIMVVAGYDTPSRVFLRNYKYYPLDYKKNRELERKDIIIKMIVSLMLLSIGAVMLFYFPSYSTFQKVISILINILTMFIAYFCLKGFENFNNFDKNTGAIAIMYELIKKFKPDNEDVVAVFLDRFTTSSLGLSHLSDVINALGTSMEILILDCVAVGDHTIFASNRRNRMIVERLAKYFDGKGKTTILLNNEDAKKSPLSFFPKSVLITCGAFEENEICVKNTRTSADIYFNLDNMEKIKECLFHYCES